MCKVVCQFEQDSKIIRLASRKVYVFDHNLLYPHEKWTNIVIK